MSDPSTNPPEGEQTPENLRDYANRMKADAEAAAARIAELEAANRRNTFLAAGVDLESPVGKLLDTAYSGDVSIDAVKAAWAEVAPQSAPAPTPVDDGPTPEELANQQARQALNTGGTPPGQEPEPEVWVDALAGYRADRERGVRTERAQQAALQKAIDGAVAGNPSVIFDEAAWKAQFDR